MNEKKVREALDFLVQDFKFLYEHQVLENYYGTCPMHIYCYHNENGCFAIAYVSYGDEVTYLRYDSIDLLKDSHFDTYKGGYNFQSETDRKEYTCFINEKLSHIINIRKYEPEIWKKHKVKLFFGRYKKELQVLAEVIKAQIDKHAEFFGIKVNK